MKNNTSEQKEHLEIVDIQEIEDILKKEHKITFDEDYDIDLIQLSNGTTYSVGTDYWGEEGATDYCITSLKEVTR